MRVDENNIRFLMKGLYVINLLIPLATLFFVSFLTLKALTYKNTIDTYEEVFLTIEEKQEENVNFNYDKTLIANKYKDIQINEYINCLNKEIPQEEFNEELKNSVNELERLFNSSYDHFAFKYTDIYTGFTISYNEKQEIFTASTIKAPMAIYLYEQAEKGLVNLDEKLTYTANYYNTGSGVLKNRKFNESYTVRELVSYAIIPSDNAAHNMLMDRFGRNNMHTFWSEKGTVSIFKQYSNWGVTNANDATIYMKELYDYYNTDTELSNELMKTFREVYFKPLSGKNNSKNTANKSGWTGSVFHDAAIVFDDNPYILVVLSNTGVTGYTYLFNKTSSLVGNIHDQYWNLKYDKCSEIISR